MAIDEQLCDVCCKLDISAYYKQEMHVDRDRTFLVGPSKDAFCLGKLTDICAKTDSCDFCRLVVDSFCNTNAFATFDDPQELIPWFKELGSDGMCYIYSYLYASNDECMSDEDLSQLTRPPSARAYQIGISVRTPQDGNKRPREDQAAKLLLTAEGAAKIGLGRTFYGRLLDSNIDKTGLARRWLDVCVSQHGLKCTIPALDPQTALQQLPPDELLVIDVAQMCLRERLAGEDYVTLSYCWPVNASGSFLTTSSSIGSMRKPGGLKKYLSQLSQVIQEVIEFVREAKWKLLWIDALCIIQDDEQHKALQIRQMARVYETAMLTIICAPTEARDGSDCRSDLPRYKKSSYFPSQKHGTIQGLSLIVPSRGLLPILNGTRWESRAWTYQEDRISRRKLFFTDAQMYFQCSCAVFCEDCEAEERRPNAFAYRVTAIDNPCGLYARHNQGGDHEIASVPRSAPTDSSDAWEVYKTLFGQYTLRQMSFPGDIISAFQGILSILRHTLDTAFLAGLPEKYLNESLLWLLRGPFRRRIVSKNGQNIVPYPSWSWAGWAPIASYFLTFEGPVRAEVEWFVIEQTGVMYRLETSSVYSLKDSLLPNSSNQKVRSADPPETLLRNLSPRAGIRFSDDGWTGSRALACWTAVATFELTGETSWMSPIRQRYFSLHTNLAIFDERGRKAGSIVMQNEWIQDEWKADKLPSRKPFEFMLLSRSFERDYENFEFEDAQYFLRRYWGTLNVLLAHRENDVVRRLGVGVIHEDAWVAASPQTMLIKLE